MMESLCRRCFTCIAFQSRRSFASIATSSAAAPAEPSVEPLIDLEAPEETPSYDDFLPDYKRPPSSFQLAASTVISRAPLLTRELTPFETEFFFYQRRLDKRLVKPFVRNFYFKPGTLAYDEWRRKRLGMKVYNPYGDEHWKDELRYGDSPQEDENMDYDSLVKYTVSGEDISASDTEEEIAAKKLMTKPLPRETEADLNNDTRSLNRKLSRTLYLLVKRGDRENNTWKFPQANIEGRQNLKQTAEGSLTKACGRDMNYWMVGNVPIGYYDYQLPDGKAKGENGELTGKKVFFMKARIFAGRPKLMGNKANIADYQWLTKEEIEGVVEKDYWKAIRRMLVTR
ncbi:54S ribosomal protein L17 mitochondrial, variant 2 [Orbilia oligospora]|nr:54S ribosomal protein L17 mitochondrial [Orbilia oligospora]KAF3294212.1 54S ribosomal protein L17 mitochondrial, variant 2 [Orbilia oligospora]